MENQRSCYHLPLFDTASDLPPLSPRSLHASSWWRPSYVAPGIDPPQNCQELAPLKERSSQSRKPDRLNQPHPFFRCFNLLLVAGRESSIDSNKLVRCFRWWNSRLVGKNPRNTEKNSRLQLLFKKQQIVWRSNVKSMNHMNRRKKAFFLPKANQY